MTRRLFVGAVLLLLLITTDAPAFAQLTRIGDASTLSSDLTTSGPGRCAVAYDANSHLFLVAWVIGRWRPVISRSFSEGWWHPTISVVLEYELSGQFADSSGGPDVRSAFSRRLLYGGDRAGVRLVYSAQFPATSASMLPGQILAVAEPFWGTVHAAAYVPPPGLSYWSDAGAIDVDDVIDMAAAYSPTSREFLFVWQTATSKILALRADVRYLLPRGDAFEVCARDCRGPAVVWNPTTNEFGVSFVHGTPDGSPSFARVTASGVVTPPVEFESASLGKSSTTRAVLDVNTATGNFVVIWNDARSNSDAVLKAEESDAIWGAEIAGDGSVIARGVISTTLRGRPEDADALDISYNPVSDTFLLLGRVSLSQTAGVELNKHGAALSSATLLADPSPVEIACQRVASRSDATGWLVAFWRRIAPSASSPYPQTVYTQAVGTSTTSGGSDWLLGVSCATPDPFEVLGGGQCVNGGWVPLVTAQVVMPPGACTPPDPFLELGGGTCVNGGWLPPGMPPPAPIGCSPPDPFAALGGGTCVNGGWLPPGMTLPPPGSCSMPDPFVALGGGTCVNGGWLPPGMRRGGS